MRECKCQVPNPSYSTVNNPNDHERCLRCGDYINPDWTSNDDTMGEFYDRLEEAIFPFGVLRAPAPNNELSAFREFCDQAIVREIAGRKKFGHRMFGRDNPREAQEEAADLMNYMAFSLLKARREGDREEWALALTAAHHAFLAWQAAGALRGHRHTGFSPS